MSTRRCALIIGSLVSLVLTGCFTNPSAPVTPVVLRLASRDGFRIHFSATANAPASSCLAQRGRLDITAIRGDTLHFSRIIDVQQPYDAAPCTWGDSGFVVASAHPDLRSRQPVFNGALTFIAAAPVVLAILLFTSGPS